MKNISLLVGLCFMLSGVFLISCGGKKDDTSEETSKTEKASEDSKSKDQGGTSATEETSDTEEKAVTLSFKKKEDMEKIVEDIRKKFGGKSVKMMNIHFYEDGRVVFDAQDPDKPENVDHYTYKNGSWQPSQPVELMGSGKLEDNVFSIEEVNLLAIPDLVKQAEEKTKDLEGAKIDHVYATMTVVRKGPDDKVTIHIPVQGTRRTKTLMANGKGEVKRFDE